MVDYKYRNLYLQPHTKKMIHIVSEDGTLNLTNEDIYWESFELNESLCSDENLIFGSCESSSVKFKIANVFMPLKGKKITVSETLEGGEDEPFVYGTYTVQSDTPTADKKHREIVAYDALYDVLNKDVANWYMSVFTGIESMTLKAFRDSFFLYLGIDQEETSLVNDGISVSQTVSFDGIDGNYSGLSGKDMLLMICEINGCFGRIGRNGKFEYVLLDQYIEGLYPSNDIFPADDLFPIDPKSSEIGVNTYKQSFPYEDYKVAEIDKIVVVQEESSVSYGSGDNAYTVSGNIMLYGKNASEMDEIMSAMLNKISGIIYRPFSADCIGDPCFETGDAVRLSTKYEVVETYIMSRVLTGIQEKNDNYLSSGQEYRSDEVNTVATEISNLKGKTNTLVRTVDETRSDLVDLEKNTSSHFDQTASQIQTEVTARENADREIKASLELKIGIDDDGTIIALINGSADKIHFNANNMFTVSSPNITIDENGQVSIGGNFIADTAMYLCYNYASLPGIAYASKINVMDLSGGSFSLYGIYSGSILEAFYSAVGTSNPILAIGKGAAVIKTNAQFQPSSIYSDTGMFKDFCIPATTGTYGGLLYKCGGSYGNRGIASAGWVKNYVSAVMPSTPDMSNYMVRSVNIISGTASVSYCLRNAYISSSGGIEFTLQQINTSDARLKDIRSKLDDVSALYMALVPETFSFKPGMDGYDSNVIHFGVDAQTTKKAMESAGLNTDDYCLVFSENPMDVFGDTQYVQDKVLKVDYNEFHGLHIAMIQKQQKEIEQLRMDNIELRGEIGILKQKMEELEYVINNKINQS